MLSKFSVKKIYTVFVCVIAIIILGVISFIKTKVDLLPSLEFPYLIVMTTYPGATPEKVEKNISNPLEDSLSTVSGIKNLQSISNENVSLVIMEFLSDTNMDSVLIDVNSKIDIVEGTWNDDMIGNPIVTKINPNMLPIMMTSIDSETLNNEELTKKIDEELVPKIERINGVASVEIAGLIKKQIKITLDQEKIDDLNDLLVKGINKKLAKTKSKINGGISKIKKAKEEMSTMGNEKLAEIVGQLNEVNEGIRSLDTISEELADKITEANKNLEVQHKELEVLDNEILAIENNSFLSASEKATQLATKIEERDTKEDKYNEQAARFNALTTQKQAINNKIDDLVNARAAIEVGKSSLVMELSKSYAELASAQGQLNSALSEFNVARDAALEKADIDSIITPDLIANVLKAENFSMPAGTINVNEKDITIKVGEEYNNLDEIKNQTLFSYDIKGLENVTLEDVAKVTIEDKEQDVYVEINNNQGVILEIQKTSDSSTSEVTDEINKLFDSLKDEKYDITNLMDQGVYIDLIITSVINNLLYGAILAIIILVLFLKDYKPTFVIAISIPISLTFAIVLMYFTGVSINMISLSGLALGVGMLVDNSIVVIENIYRLKKNGMSATDAAIKGASSITGAILSSTLTTICVFLPIVFIEGITKQLFVDMGLTITYSLLASLIVALTVVPAISSTMFNKLSLKENKSLNKFTEFYGKILKYCLDHKAILISTILIFFVSTIVIATNMKMEFIPEAQSEQMSISVTFDDEVTDSQMRETASKIVEKLLKLDDINKIGSIDSSSVGMMGMSGRGMTLYLILNTENRKYSNEEIKEQILSRTKDFDCSLNVSTSNMDLSMLTSTGIQVIIKGDKIDDIKSSVSDIEKIMSKVKGFSKVENSITDQNDEVYIKIDKNKAMEYGLTVAGIYSNVSSKLKNEIESSSIIIDSKEYPVIVVKQEEKQVKKGSIEDIILEGQKDNESKDIELGDIAEISDTKSLSSIAHINQSRYLTVTGYIEEGYNISLVSKDFEKEFNKYKVPENIDIELAGENETIVEAIIDLLVMVLLAIVLIYLIMVAVFQSLKYPFIVMFTIPLAITGGLLALFITGTSLSIIAMLGFLVLSGVVVNNAIVFIDYANQLRSEGYSTRDALLETGKTRLKPILMTALTTILSLVTMALGIGSGAETIQPLGIVTIGGLTYATALTLLFIPVMYEIMSKKKTVKSKKRVDK